MKESSQRLEESRPVFWQEVYWFLLVCLGGWTLGILVLAPRLSRHRSVLDMERELKGSVARLEQLEREYDAAIQAMETDTFYREEAIRSILKVKKPGEEFLEAPAAPREAPAR
ncbi:MAG TPA: hypothetical protein VFD71_08285 [Planctomycetota bacterium]|nr:hypothetical protein [Planctomycetota bacterium]